MSEQPKTSTIKRGGTFRQSNAVKKVEHQGEILQADSLSGDLIGIAAVSNTHELSDASDVQSFPTGDNLDEYIDWQAWSNVRWAWEFLRRNQEYAELCNMVKNGSIDVKKCKRIVKRKFGLLDFKDCFEPFDMSASFKPPRFVSAKVASFSRVTRKQEKAHLLVSKIRISRGEVLIRFDVTQIDTLRSLKGQIAAATELLKLRENQWLKRKEVERGKGQRNNYYLLSLLRLLDFDKTRKTVSTYGELTNSKVYQILYPFTLDEKKSGVIPSSQDVFDKEFYAARKKAESYTKKGRYLDMAAFSGVLPVSGY